MRNQVDCGIKPDNIGRWKNCTGPKGRWKGNLITKIARAGVAFDNPGISPVVRSLFSIYVFQYNDLIWRPSTGSVFETLLGIRDILVRIRIRGSVPLPNGSGSRSHYFFR
jgi:hypothetical protein